MSRLFPVLLRERGRRYKKFILEKPFLAIGLLSSFVFLLASIWQEPFCISGFLDNAVVVFAVMVYLIAKIINPTQGMTLDYQLLELKLISLTEYKILLGIKLFAGSIILSCFCITSYTKMAAVISALNVVVNIWVFLRNRWDSRVYDFLLALIVVFCMRYQALSLSVLCLILISGIYIALKRVNYDAVLSLYKLMYKIGQQRYNGVVYSEQENRDIQVSAETLLGKAKAKSADWCERFYEKTGRFMMYKELARIVANSDKIVTYCIICILIGMGRFYLPGEYIIAAVLLLAGITLNFDMEMNRAEANLFLRGFISRYVFWDIVKNKLPVYTVVNVLLMFLSVLFGWKWLLFSLAASLLTALFALYKCFFIKAK